MKFVTSILVFTPRVTRFLRLNPSVMGRFKCCLNRRMIYVTRWPGGHAAGGVLNGVAVLESFVLTQRYINTSRKRRGKFAKCKEREWWMRGRMLVERMSACVAISWNALRKRTRSHVLERLPSFKNAQFCSLSNSMEKGRTQNVMSCLVIPWHVLLWHVSPQIS